MNALLGILLTLYALSGVWMLSTIGRSQREAIASYATFAALALACLIIDGLRSAS